MVDSQDTGISGAGLYPFFSNYNTCLDSFALLSMSDLEEPVHLVVDSMFVPKPTNCQKGILSMKAIGHEFKASIN